MEKLYFKYRKAVGTHKGNRYTPSFFFNTIFEDKLDYITMLDNKVPEEMYLTPKRFGIVEYDETKISREDLIYDITNSLSSNHIRICVDKQEAIDFMLEFTDQRKLKFDGIDTFSYTQDTDSGENENITLTIE